MALATRFVFQNFPQTKMWKDEYIFFGYSDTDLIFRYKPGETDFNL
jgi:hypothetical protein